METKNATKGSLLDRFLNTVERVCNRLPPPAILFCILFVITAVVGAICTQAGFALENPASHKIVTSQNFSPSRHPMAADHPGEELYRVCSFGSRDYHDPGHRVL